jgi:ATP-dependent exoDNAse (exonuclease V) beta subunit
VRPPRGDRSIDDAVAPGLHRPQLGEHTVVWWDPSALPPGREDQVGLRQQEILKPDEGGANSDASIRAHDLWQRRRAEISAQGSRPTLTGRTVTEHTRDAALSAGPPVAIERVAPPATRPHGRRFGTLVHAVLAEIPFDAAPPAIEAAASVHGRYLGCSSPEIAASVSTITLALAHPLLRRAAAAQTSGLCHRELPLALRLDDGTVLDGVVDLAFAEPGAPWTVVDFKTDLATAQPNRLAYEEQVRLYARAISESTSRPAHAVLLYV